MELALYCPECGYYEAEGDNLGRRGDFFTSVSVGPLFGELLAFRFASWLADWAQTFPGPAKIAEAGAHDGSLAADILETLRQEHPKLFDIVEYWIVEPSARRRGWQEKRLETFKGKVHWTANLDGLAPESTSYQGIIFCNELLDAMPLRRFGWDAARKQWFEWGVTLQSDQFCWVRMESPTSDVFALLDLGFGTSDLRLPPSTFDLRTSNFFPLLDVLPDGFTVEISPAALNWWSRAARLVSHGALVTLDYGLTTQEFFLPHRAEGTLRSYRSHRLVSDPLANAGEQDITAHVNFSLLQEAGERAGLRTEAFVTQAQFLTDIAARIWSQPGPAPTWNAHQTGQFRTLTDPSGLGRFKVLLQIRP